MRDAFAVDVGGTFTDVAVLDATTNEVRLAKAPTTPAAPESGVVDAVRKAAVDTAGAELFFHGTTLGLNTLLEGKGARTGVLTTEGMRDVLEIRRMSWPMYLLHWDQPAPLVPRFLRAEVRERVRADGQVLVPLDEEDVAAKLDALLAHGAEAIAVCFLHAYAHPQHEQRVGEIVAERYPGVDVTLSHLVSQEYREYERTSTTVANAMIKRRMVRYIESLSSSLADEGFKGELLVTRCDGGVMRAEEVKRRSVRTLVSGPASGVMGASALGRELGLRNLITIDMGGTSFDAAVIVDHEPILNALTHVGSNPLLMPVIEIATIGAGGGSIAWIDTGGALNVGPQSSGADPGPICYGAGGTEPTFTDAAVVSGLLDPQYFLGGEMTLDIEAARAGIEERIAGRLGVSVDEAASGIVTLVEAKMAATLETITIEKGYDPRDFTLVAYGGGGPWVASALAARLEIPRIVIPRSPGTFSAWGMLTLDTVHDFAKTEISRLDDLQGSDIARLLGELETEAREALDREHVPEARRQGMRSIDMRYENQEHTLPVPIAQGSEQADVASLRRSFDERHRAAYGYDMPEPVEVVAYRLRAVGLRDKPAPITLARGESDSSAAITSTRRATHRESGGEFEWSIVRRDLLLAGNEVPGPAIVEESTSTTVVAPNQTARVDAHGNLLITTGSGQ